MSYYWGPKITTNGLVFITDAQNRTSNPNNSSNELIDLIYKESADISDAGITIDDSIINFNGTSTAYADYGNLDKVNFGTSDFSFMVALKTSATETYNYFLGKGALGGNIGWGIFTLESNGAMYFQTRNGANTAQINSAEAVNDGEWRIYTFRRLNGIVEMFINNIKEVDTNSNLQNLDTTEYFGIGARNEGAAWSYAGAMDFSFLSIWDYGLSDYEVTKNYESIKGRFINRINPKICDYRYGAVSAISQCTDQAIATSRYAAELYGFKHNVGLTIFDNPEPFTSYLTDRIECETSGRINFGIYHRTDRWRDLSYGGSDLNLKYPQIPDYYYTSWTSAGVAVFSGAVLGASKITRTPNHGQELYDISDGFYGYDESTETFGTTNLLELYDLMDQELDYFEGVFSRRFSSFSFRNGQEGGAIEMIPKILAGRNSSSLHEDVETSTAPTYCGTSKYSGDSLGYPASTSFNRNNWINRSSSTRWWDLWHWFGYSENVATTIFEDELNKSILNKGWMNDFVHWHSCYDAGDNAALGRFYTIIDDTIDTNFVWRAGYGEIAEYSFFRDVIKNIRTSDKINTISLILEIEDHFDGTFTNGISNTLDLDAINTPISIEINLANTSLANKNIKSDDVVGIRSMGSDRYIVDIAFSATTEYEVLIEEELGTSDYYDFSLPEIRSATLASEVLTVVTDMSTKCAVFIANRNAAIETSTLLSRSNTLGTEHDITLTSKNQAKDIYIGVITKEKQSILSSVYQFA